MVAHKISRFGFSEVLVQHAVQTTGLVDISVHTIFNALGRVPREVIGLALHGSQACILEVQPRLHLVVFPRASGERDLVVRIILLCQVFQDTAGFEQSNLLAITEGVRQCGNAAVGVNLEEPAVQRLASLYEYDDV